MRCAQMIKSFLEVMHHFEEGFDHCGGISFWGHTMRAFKNTPTNFWRIFPHSVWWKACVSLLWFWSFLRISAFFNRIFAPRAVVISSLEPLKSSWKKLFNGTRLDIRSARGAEIFFFLFWKNARFCVHFHLFDWFLRFLREFRNTNNFWRSVEPHRRCRDSAYAKSP